MCCCCSSLSSSSSLFLDLLGEKRKKEENKNKLVVPKNIPYHTIPFDDEFDESNNRGISVSKNCSRDPRTSKERKKENKYLFVKRYNL